MLVVVTANDPKSTHLLHLLASREDVGVLQDNALRQCELRVEAECIKGYWNILKELDMKEQERFA